MDVAYEGVIGEKILEINPSLNSVFKKTEPVKGEFRIRDVELIAGINKSETVHKENKCVYELDIRRVYFSPRLATEHDRVCSLVKDGEVILDMFAGVGPFSVLIAKIKRNQVVAVDINPVAIYYLKKNIILNKVEKNITVFAPSIRFLDI